MVKLSPADSKDVQKFIGICQQVLHEDLLSIILFGSVAKGRSHRYSDIDFCIITKKNRENEKYNILKLFPRTCDVIMRVEYNLNDYLQNLSAVDLEIIEEGTTVYGLNITKEKKKILNDIKKKNHLIRKPEWGKGVWEIGAAS